MRRSSVSVAVLAVSAILVPLVVAAPAQASVRASTTEVVAPETVWTPPEDAAIAEVPDDLNVPNESWAPPTETRLQQERDANARGVTPMGAPAGTLAGAPGLGEMPWFSFQDFQLAPDTSAQVNIANGNLLVKANDLSVPVPGYGLRHDRFYNGLSTNPGSQGGGWQSNNAAYDVGLDWGVTPTNADFYGPNGVKIRFTRTGSSGSTGTFSSPPGSNMTLREDFSTQTFRFVLTMNKTGEQFKFASQGWLTATVDRNGVGEYYSYSMGQMVTSYHDNGRGIVFDFSDDGRLLAARDTAQRKVEYTYDPNTYVLKTVKSVDGKITTYNYDSSGRLSSMIIPSAAAATTTITFAYDSSHRVTKVAQQPGIETSFAYTAGQTVVTDSNGKTATYAIDSSGRVTSAKDALNRTRSQTWTANSDIATSTDAFGTNNTTYTYDGNSNRTNAQLPTGAAASAVYAVGANCSAPNTGTAFQAKCSTDDAGNKKQYQYDGAGNLTKQTDTTTSTAVTEFERTYGTCGGFAGQVCTTKDGNGNVTSYQYNADGDLTTVTPPAPLGATTYTYDSLGRVTSVKDGKGDTTAYQYDVRDRIVLTAFEDGENYISTYYSNGLEHTRTDSAGGVVTLDYDHQGRLTKQTGPRAGVTQTYTYDEVGNILTYADSGGTTTYTYDAANQLTKVREPGGTCPTSGNPAANSGCILLEYNTNGAETKRVLPGGASTVTVRDNSGRPTRITAKTATGTTAVDIGYSYTATGSAGDRSNVQTRTAHAEQGVTPGAVTAYTYDSRNRLTLAQEKSGSTTTASWSYAYDPNGNRTKQVRSGSTGATAGTINYGYNAANQLTSVTGQSTSWTHDAAGNQTRNGLTGITSVFGDRGEQTVTGTTSGTYFGTGNTDRLSSGSLTFNNGSLGLMQRVNGSTTQHFTRTADGTAIGFKAANRWYYIQDHLGSVVGIFSATGTYSGGYSYSPYGESRATGTSSAVTTNALRYIGGHHDGGGIYKLGARYYDTSLGRFTQMDPSGQEANPYIYGSPNPINGSDPSGTRWVSAALEYGAAAVDAWMNGTTIGEALSGSLGWNDVGPSIVGGLTSAACFAGVTASATLTAGGTALLGLGCAGFGELVGRTAGGVFYGEW